MIIEEGVTATRLVVEEQGSLQGLQGGTAPLRAALHGIAGSQGLQGLQGGTDQQQQGSAKRHARGDSGAAAATAVAPSTEKEKNLRVLYQIRTPKVPAKGSARGEEEVSFHLYIHV